MRLPPPLPASRLPACLCGRSIPQIFENRSFVSCAPDIWALGVILFIMLTGIPPVTQPSVVDPRFKHIAAVSDEASQGGRCPV